MRAAVAQGILCLCEETGLPHTCGCTEAGIVQGTFHTSGQRGGVKATARMSMANAVTSLCCVVLAAAVVVFAQKRSLQGARVQYERIGSDVTMQCGALEADASVTWKVNGTDLKAQRLERGPLLTLMEVDLSSNGLYSCFQNPNGERRDQINLRVGSE
ncbi:ciliary neurotrophic factor receptor subunit alpha isoform X1 [Arapaima gigas]